MLSASTRGQIAQPLPRCLEYPLPVPEHATGTPTKKTSLQLISKYSFSYCQSHDKYRAERAIKLAANASFGATAPAMIPGSTLSPPPIRCITISSRCPRHLSHITPHRATRSTPPPHSLLPQNDNGLGGYTQARLTSCLPLSTIILACLRRRPLLLRPPFTKRASQPPGQNFHSFRPALVKSNLKSINFRE